MSSKRTKIALVTNWFPPKSGVAVNRMRAFGNYLSEEMEVHVFCDGDQTFTEKLSENLIVHYSKSKTILDRIKSSSKDGKLIHNAKTLLRIVLMKVIKNPMQKWVLACGKELEREHLSQPFDYVISSFAPKEPHEIALIFKKKYKEVKWVADMRDEMMNNQNLNQVQSEELGKLEKQVGEHCDMILSVSLPIVEVFQKNYPKVPAHEIRNGFDFDTNALKGYTKGETIQIGYFGTFYGRRKPGTFFQAMENLMKSVHIPSIEIHFVGTHRNFDIPDTLKSSVVFHDAMGYTEAVQFMSTMTANMMLEPITGNKGIFTGKLFDYLGVQRPVIAMTDTTDVAAQLVLELEAGYVASFNDIDEQVQVLKEFIQDFKSDTLKKPNDQQVASLHRREEVQKLIALLHNL